MLGLFQAVKGALWLSNSNESLQQKDEPTKKTETTTLTGRVTQYDKAKRSGMVNHSIYFDNDVIIGGETPQVGSEVNVHAERDHSLAGWKATKVTIISQLKASFASDVVNKVGYILDEGRTSCLVLCGEIDILGVLATALVFDFGEFRITRSVRARVIDEAIYMMQPTRPYTRHFNNHSSYNYVHYSDKLRAVTTPGQRPIRKKNVRLPYKLKLYPIVPDDIRECFDLEEDVTFVRSSILEPLSLKTHKEVFSALLCCEELQIEKNIRVFDMNEGIVSE